MIKIKIGITPSSKASAKENHLKSSTPSHPLSFIPSSIFSYLIMVFILLYSFTSNAQFIHPGISHKQSDLDRMHYLVSAKVNPYYESYLKLKSDGKASYDYKVQGDPSFTVITEKSTNSNAFKSDVEAAYLNALMWAVTKDTRHADKCVEIFNSWSNLTCFTGGGTESLNTGRVIFCFLDAAEIIKSTYSGWKPEDIQKFKDMLVYPGYSNVAKPASVTNNNGTFYWRLYQGDAGRHGNQDLFGWRGVLSMGIFLDNEIMYHRGLRYLKGLPHREDDIPYESGPPITSASPVSRSEFADVYQFNGRENTIPDYGYNGTIGNLIWENGQSQESSRDQAHTILGVGQLASVAEMAWNQGDDIYSYLDNRILLGYEFSLKYNVSYKHPFPDQPTPWEPTVESGEFIQRRDRSGRWFSKKMNPFSEGQFEDYTRGNFLSSARPVYEIAYAHYKVRQGVDSADMVWLSRARDICFKEVGQEQNGYGLDHLGYGGLTCFRPDGCAGDPISGIKDGMPVFALNVLPGNVEAENFDHFPGGGELRVYHDQDTINSGQKYRLDTGVDIDTCSEGGYALSDLQNGEWITYSCFVPEAGTYQLDLRYAANQEGGAIRLALNTSDVTDNVSLPSTGDFSSWATQTITDKLILSQGLHPIRFYIAGTSGAMRINNFSLFLLQANTAPEVAITAPLNSDGLVEGESTIVTADASDLEGKVEKVAFYVGENMLGVDEEAPFSAEWHYLPGGSYIITAVATDNNGATSISEEVPISIVAGTGSQEIINLSPIADTYVHAAKPGTNFGSDTYMVTKSGERYLFLKFDLSDIDGVITYASLKIYSKHARTTNRTVYRAFDDSWTENGLNWGNKPDYAGKISSVSSTPVGYVNWNVTDFVAIENGTDKIVTLVVKDPDNTSTGVDFYTKEYGANTPQLAVLKKSVSSAMDNLKSNTELEVYPNPLTERATIKLQKSGYKNVTIYDILGNKMFEKMLSGTEDRVELDFHSFTKGAYIIRFISDNTNSNIKVIKK